MKNSPKYILVHCTDYSYSQLFDQRKACEGWHKDRDFPVSSLGSQVGYHVLITGDINYQCRLDEDEGAHCNTVVNGLSMNYQSLGIAIGFDGDIEMPTATQYALLQKQVWAWQDKYNIPNDKVYYHRAFSPSKTCPGSLLDDKWLKTLLTRPKPVITPSKPLETMCIAQEEEIKKLKEQLSWFDRIVSAIFRRS